LRTHKVFDGASQFVHVLHFTPPERHYSDRCLAVVQESLPQPIVRTHVTLPVGSEESSKAHEYLLANGIKPDDFLIGFHSTFSGSTAFFARKRRARLHRTWPQDHFIRLAALLHEHARSNDIPLKIVIDVLPGEGRLVDPIARQSNGRIRIICGPPDFQRYKAVLARMNLFVTPDTGPMHVAAAVGAPVVALFSYKSPGDCGPYTAPEKYAVLRAEDTETPGIGLAAIQPESVFRACLPFLP
jgi:ADP-heptose:LPS heptosyltransferase